MERYICVDIGGTSIKHGLICTDGEFVEKGSLDTQAWKGAGHILERVNGVIENYMAENTVNGLCISTAGIVDPCPEKSSMRMGTFRTIRESA